MLIAADQRVFDRTKLSGKDTASLSEILKRSYQLSVVSKQ